MKNEGFLAKKMTISNRSIQSGPRAYEATCEAKSTWLPVMT